MKRLALRLSHPLIITMILMVMIDVLWVVLGSLSSAGSQDLSGMVTLSLMVVLPMGLTLWFLVSASEISKISLGVVLLLYGLFYLLIALLSWLIPALILGIIHSVVAIFLFITSINDLRVTDSS